jgi:hypothetical protein
MSGSGAEAEEGPKQSGGMTEKYCRGMNPACESNRER